MDPATTRSAPSRASLRRPRVDELLASAWQRRVVLIAAGPGYGKSTALAALQGIVVQLASTDRRRDDLVTRVRSALQIESPTPIEDVVVGADDPVALAEMQAAHICAGVEGHGDELLILDEVERIAADDGAVAFLRALCLQAPSGLHVVLSGRVIPSMGLGEAAGRGEVVRIGATELAFTPDEVGELVAQRLGTDDHALAAAISARTGGWPAAVCLLLDAMSRVGDRADLVALLSGDSAPWRDFASEIVTALPDDTRALLTAAAVAGTAEPQLLTELGVRSSDATLAELVDRGLLVHTESGARVSDVLVGALLSAAEPATSDAWRERAAAWFEQQHRLAEALDCHSAGSAAELTEFLTRCGHQLVMSGSGRRVADELRATGPDPSTDVLLGEALWAAGDWDGAYDVFTRMRFGTSGMPAAAAWRFGSLLYLRGDVDVAVEVLTSAHDGDPSDLALASAWLASALWSRGDVDDAAAAAARADADALACGDARSRAAAQVAIALVAASRGDRERNAQAYRVALSAATEAGDSLQAARILANLASRAMEEGDYSAAIEHADRAMHVGAGHRFFTALALTNKSEALLRLGEIDAARTAAAEAFDSYTALGSLHAASALVQLAEIQRQGGDNVQARLAFERAARMAQAGGDAHTIAIAYLALAWLLATQDPAAAVTYARDAVEHASSLEMPAALVAQAWAELHGEHPEDVDRLARQAEAQARETGDRPVLITAIQLRAVATDPPAIALLDEALAVCEQIGDPLASIRARLAIAAAKGDSAEVDVQRRLLSDRGAAELGIATLLVNRLAGRTGSAPSITTLGAFAVTLGGRPVPANAWQSRKARDLLKLLIAHDGRPVPRDAAAEALWPGQAPTQLANRLSVALSTVRKVLDPERAQPTDHYIAADARALTVRTDHVRVDVTEFFASVAEAVRAADQGDWTQADRKCADAELLYRGDFLEEDRYEDWALDCRERARTNAGTAVRLRARAARERGDREAAAMYLLRLVDRDPYDEDSWTALIALQTQLRRHGEARRLYSLYSRRMDELDIAPAPFAALTAGAR